MMGIDIHLIRPNTLSVLLIPLDNILDYAFHHAFTFSEIKVTLSLSLSLSLSHLTCALFST